MTDSPGLAPDSMFRIPQAERGDELFKQYNTPLCLCHLFYNIRRCTAPHEITRGRLHKNRPRVNTHENDEIFLFFDRDTCVICLQCQLNSPVKNVNLLPILKKGS